MGYDCTYHLIDEKAIREEFVPKLLGDSTQETRFDQVREDAAQLWVTVRRALAEGVNDDGEPLDVDDVASLVCQLAVMFSSCYLPHHYERGLALSLWPDDVKSEFPFELAFSPEPMFAAVVGKYPRLKGKFPNWFTGNYCTGVFVPTEQVTKVREWVESTISKLDKGRQRDFRGLVAVLKTAEAKNLAYWEATDLAIPMLNQVPGDPHLMTADFLRKLIGGETCDDKFTFSPKGNYDRKGGLGDIHVLTLSRPDTTLILDLSCWPPKSFVRENEFLWNADCDAQGHWAFASRTGTGEGYPPARGRLLADLRGQPTSVFALEGEDAEIYVKSAFLVAGRPVLVPNVPGRDKDVGQLLHVWLQDGDKLIHAPGLAPHTVKAGRIGNEWIVHDLARLADGSEVFMWEGNGYEWDGQTFRMTFPMQFTDAYDDLSSIPVGTDGFYCISGRKLYKVQRGRAPVHIGTRWTNVMSMLPGPNGGLLLKEGDNKDGDLGKLFFPEDNSYISIEPELLGNHKVYDFLCWSEKADRFIASTRYSLFAVPTEAVLSKDRRNALTGRKMKKK